MKVHFRLFIIKVINKCMISLLFFFVSLIIISNFLINFVKFFFQIPAQSLVNLKTQLISAPKTTPYLNKMRHVTMNDGRTPLAQAKTPLCLGHSKVGMTLMVTPTGAALKLTAEVVTSLN